jgi:tRNA A37 methylthiotransferase MiaB
MYVCACVCMREGKDGASNAHPPPPPLCMVESIAFPFSNPNPMCPPPTTQIVRAIMEGANYQWTDSTADADVIYLNTCAIRENAEQRVFGRLASLKGMYKRTRGSGSSQKQQRRQQGAAPAPRKVVGVLGCMAERLKERLLEEAAVDLVAGPDAYRDLPRLLGLVASGQTAINVQLSQEETYAEVAPIRIHPEQQAAFVSIMRGCNNMCTYCIVPFTRGRERSRPVGTILEEVRRLSDQGIKEVRGYCGMGVVVWCGDG